MIRLKLRSQFLSATLVVIATLTGASLLIIRYTVRSEIDRQVQRGVTASVSAFESVQQQRELQLSRSAALLAEQPLLKALMTTQHAPTIQDASSPLWKLSGSELLVLTNPGGDLLAFHAPSGSATRDAARQFAVQAVERGRESAWWFNGGALFWTFLRPITSGTDKDRRLLGYLILGYQIDDKVAEELAHVSGSQIVLTTERQIIASTLPEQNGSDLSMIVSLQRERLARVPHDLSIAGKAYAAGAVMVQPGPETPIYCYVLMPLSQAEEFLKRLNETILILGIAAVCVAAAFITWISRAITRPLDNLLAGVCAISAGDFSYEIHPTGSAEVAELGAAVAGMRISLQESQRLRLQAEQHAVVSRTASAISHDLRHYLGAVLANAEFLYDSGANNQDRREIYSEIRTASDQMVELIDSLRELSNEQAAMTIRDGRLDDALHRAAVAVQARAQFKQCNVEIVTHGDMNGTFDSRKIERVFFNLVLNACEATQPVGGRVSVEMDADDSEFTVRVRDAGSGIPDAIRERIFDPFVSVGKPNGSGLGLAIVQKIVRDHEGTVEVESTSRAGTVMLLRLPRHKRVVALNAQPVA